MYIFQKFILFFFSRLLNRQAFENIYSMLRPNGIMLVLFVTSHNIFNVLENLIHDVRFAPYIKVNIVI